MKLTCAKIDTWEKAMEIINEYLGEKNIKVNKVVYNPEKKELEVEIKDLIKMV